MGCQVSSYPKTISSVSSKLSQKDFQPGAKSAYVDTLLDGRFLFLLKDAQKLSVCLYTSRQQSTNVLLSFLYSDKTIWTEPALFLALQRLQACRSHAAEQTVLKLSAERLSQSFTRWRKTVPGRHPPLSSCLSTNPMELLYCERHPGVEMICYGPRNLQSLLYVTHLQPSSPSYH